MKRNLALSGVAVSKTVESFHLTVSLSSDNTEQDKIDMKLWKDLQKRIKEIMKDSKYVSISPM